MEDIQDLMDIEQKSDAENTQVVDKIKDLKQRILNEKITPIKQKNAADKFFRALGRGCEWGTKPSYHNCSIDARLLGCASCGMKDYDNIDESEIKREYTFLPLNKLDLLKLTNKDANAHKKQINMKPLYLPIDDEGHLKAFVPWKVKSVYLFSDPLDAE